MVRPVFWRFLASRNSAKVTLRANVLPCCVRLPYIVASFVGSVSSAVLASIGLETLGLGHLNSPSIGVTIYWLIYYSAVLNGWWWWFVPPIVIIVIVFVGLFMTSTGMDELANPKLRRTV